MNEMTQATPPQQDVPLSLAHFFNNYTSYKVEEQTEMIRLREKSLQSIYEACVIDYRDPSYLNAVMMRTIDDGLTEVIVFREEEDDDIALWKENLVNLFETGAGRGPSLREILSQQLSDEFTITIDCDLDYVVRVTLSWSLDK